MVEDRPTLLRVLAGGVCAAPEAEEHRGGLEGRRQLCPCLQVGTEGGLVNGGRRMVAGEVW